jgi:hypothetical protein
MRILYPSHHFVDGLERWLAERVDVAAGHTPEIDRPAHGVVDVV